jgi:hypothetical protein
MTQVPQAAIVKSDDSRWIGWSSLSEGTRRARPHGEDLGVILLLH